MAHSSQKISRKKSSEASNSICDCSDLGRPGGPSAATTTMLHIMIRLMAYSNHFASATWMQNIRNGDSGMKRPMLRNSKMTSITVSTSSKVMSKMLISLNCSKFVVWVWS